MLEGKSVVIAGGGSGIGRGTALAARRAGRNGAIARSVLRAALIDPHTTGGSAAV